MSARSRIHSYEDARRLARRHLPRMVFDYIDGAAGLEAGNARNRQMLSDIWLQPKVLRNVQQRSLAGKVFGTETGLPFGIAPMGMCNMTSPDADRCMADCARAHRIPLGVSTLSTTSLEEMQQRSGGQAWFQLYVSGGLSDAEGLIARAEAAGYDTLIFTVDVPELGRRLREQRRGFVMPFRIGLSQFWDFALHPRWSVTQLLRGRPEMANFGAPYGAFERAASRAGSDWDVLAQLRARWKGRLVLKGVLCPEDAKRAQAAGVDAIQVSSHGGRQLDSGVPPIHALPLIRQAVGPDFPVFYDSGMRSGEDIIKAYALGADFVFMGRPFSFAIAAAGAKGLADYIDSLKADLHIALAQIGCRNMAELTPEVIARA
ncbi:alpha-hydroxy acid oxidase [Cognatishimia sp. SS12]|uniref:alpha-hydroxy acid oxidase n=1 Tax=Cognatishimia sp. SS12 TaxID=2979465 RepID=UPI00232ABEE8|nr:alpha-hydroxy acid oxidase [Cognatishimia sp. SS12]MDC0739127.1 alpha-hydroxy acid oxidase [Cognatishimia sp. SS12]